MAGASLVDDEYVGTVVKSELDSDVEFEVELIRDSVVDSIASVVSLGVVFERVVLLTGSIWF